jgi:hypothetical protein
MPSRLLVPRDLMPGNPDTVEAYLAYALARATKAGRSLIEDERVLAPCVNGGRWVMRCPHCKSFSMVNPDWDVAACFGAGCYRYFRSLVWPDDVAAIEAALVDRPFERQHFGFERTASFDLSVPVETAAELAIETAVELAKDIAVRQPKPVIEEPIVDEPLADVPTEDTTP